MAAHFYAKAGATRGGRIPPPANAVRCRGIPKSTIISCEKFAAIWEFQNQHVSDCCSLESRVLSKASEMPFTPTAAIQMLQWGANPDSSPYTHKQIARWCDRFWCTYLDVDAPEEIEKLLPILTDVETQWDLYLANIYSLDQLKSNSFEEERLPVEWFQEWLRQALA